MLEWGQFSLFLVAGIFAVLAVGRLRRQHRVAAMLVGLFAVAAVFAAGEEISWGQRLLGWGTPEALGDINHQEETNLHNITTVPVQKAFNYLQLAAGLYGGVVAVVLRSIWRRRPFLADLLLPAVFLAPAFLLMAVYRLARLTVLTDMRYVLVKIGELPETSLALAFAGFAYTVWTSARRDDVPARDPAATVPAEIPATTLAGSTTAATQPTGPVPGQARRRLPPVRRRTSA